MTWMFQSWFNFNFPKSRLKTKRWESFPPEDVHRQEKEEHLKACRGMKTFVFEINCFLKNVFKPFLEAFNFWDRNVERRTFPRVFSFRGHIFQQMVLFSTSTILPSSIIPSFHPAKMRSISFLLVLIPTSACIKSFIWNCINAQKINALSRGRSNPGLGCSWWVLPSKCCCCCCFVVLLL